MLTNPRTAFKGQSRSFNMVPFDMLGMVSYQCAIVSLSLRLQKMLWPWNPGEMLLKVIGTDPPYDFLLTFNSNHGPILYRFRDKRWFQSKITKLAMRMRGITWPVSGECKIITYVESQNPSFLLTA